MIATFSKQLYFFARAIFQRMQIFRTDHCGRLTSFSQLHFIYNLVINSINTGPLKDPKRQRCAESAALLRNLSFKYHGQKLLHKNCFFRAALNRTIYEKKWKTSVLRVFNKNINLITESAKKPTIYDLQFILQLSSTWNEKWPRKQLLYYKRSFSGLGTFLTTDLKCWLIRFFQKKCLLPHCPIKKYESNKYRVICSFF